MDLSHERAIGTSVIVIIVIVILVVAAGAVYYVTTIPSTSTTSSSTSSPTSSMVSSSSSMAPPTVYKVALVGASTSSNYFGEFFEAGAEAAAKAVSNSTVQISVTEAWSVSASQVVSVCQAYAAQGYKLIELYVDYAGTYAQIAKAVPNVEFVDEFNTPNKYNGTTYNYADPDSNVYTYNATNMVGWDTNIYGAYYVAGVAAALTTKTGSVGYEAAFNIAALGYWYNNFALGVHSVNPSMKVYYTFTNDWSDPTKGAAAADSLISEGAGVVSTAGDTQSIGAAKEAVSKGAYGIGYPTNLNNLSASWMLGSVYFNSTKLWIDILHDALTNNLAGHYYSIDLAHGGNSFVVNPALISSGVITSSMMTQINAAAAGLTNYSIKLPFDATFPPEPS